ncbi:hypothetical protein HG536_0G01900 [Torulaspora globosa]|uniref:Uncharacterized protein n=1 Tax=Torulaspora globosa TaxID=48254 RepID=A0A7G3ZLE5_9SACH|nr:uncharacterized protein HG536_0G01900 [Torulaspora globosa]QLL34331.1 hypothetical protein HG536_0G01900 [Torulaspora globosa]
MHDAVVVELAQTDFDYVLAEHFNDKEQFILYANEQDFDLDTCLEICDGIELLNQDIIECQVEERSDIALAESDFKEMLQMEENGRIDMDSAVNDLS